MNIKENQTKQKLMGAYYTPDEIVDFMLRWTIESDKSQRILEPSAGDGQFLRRIKEINRETQITAIEINEEESKKIPINLNCDVKVLVDDFYKFYEERRFDQSFDVVLGNPPYIRYQFLSETQREFQSDILMNNGLVPNKLINSWVAFSVATLEMLKAGGKFAFVLPTDLLQVSYAKQLRTFFREVFSELNIVTFENLVFDGIQQDVILVMGIKKSYIGEETKLRTIHITDKDELERDISRYELDEYTDFESDKWSSLNLPNDQRRYYDRTLKRKTIPITDLAKIEVGITTGNNKYFVVNKDTLVEFSLKEYVRPLLGRSVDTFGITYSQSDIELNDELNKDIWLLDFNNKSLNSGASNYISYGEKNEQNKGYKLKIRNKWYEIPSIWVPDAFLLRRIGQYPKLIQNLSQAVSTDTFHRLKIENPSYYSIEELIFLFYSSPAMLSVELEGRVFGGGALEILPGDLKNVRIPMIKGLKNISDLFKQLDSKFRNNESIYNIVKWVDEQLFLSGQTDIDLNITYLAWSKKNINRYSK